MKSNSVSQPERQSPGRLDRIGRPCPSKRLSAVEKQRDRSVVHQFDRHLLLKTPRRHGDPLPCYKRHEVLVKRLGDFRASGAREARPTSLTAVSHQRELADDEHLAADICQ